jgi:hypothetical protein
MKTGMMENIKEMMKTELVRRRNRLRLILFGGIQCVRHLKITSYLTGYCIQNARVVEISHA